MPTPMPIIAASSVPKVGTVSARLNRSMTPIPMPIPNRAVRIGRPMAITDPKAMSRMTIAARTPIVSLEPGLAVSAFVIGCPASSTWKPGRFAARAVSTTRATSFLARLSVVASNWISAYAVWPFGATCPSTP